MFKIRLFRQNEPTIETGGTELLDAWREDPGTSIWVDIEGRLDPADMQTLADAFGLHPLALQDAARDRHPPKFEAFSRSSFLIYKALSADSDTIDCRTIQLALFVGERFLVTRHSSESPGIERLADELKSGRLSSDKGPGAWAVRLSRIIVERYLKILLALEPRLEELESIVLTTGDDTVLSELIGYKSDLTRLRRYFHYHVDVISDLRHPDNPGFGAKLEHEINDLFEHQERVASLADLYYQLASDLIDGYISVSSHRLNQIMRVLTIITAIFVPLSFLAGIYGMNFENMPELKSRWGYYFLLGTMVSLVTFMLYFFRRKRWL